ncbi:hypothetical protein G7Z17_g12094 [Cylindrodendrum hubeiense]|uniref:Uncharacterized protein n=1 Tax=Cylindrodendrum hubeiense TaxID=595255 RepID=A0A9P5GZQ9_9HYPO|nr:hypothetical protein G7Z17_g12094 [Cylindrodendrum hubeiense]
MRAAMRSVAQPLRLSTSPPLPPPPPPPSPPTTNPPFHPQRPEPHPEPPVTPSNTRPRVPLETQKMVLTTETGPLGTGTSQLGMAHRSLPMTRHPPSPSPPRAPDARHPAAATDAIDATATSCCRYCMMMIPKTCEEQRLVCLLDPDGFGLALFLRGNSIVAIAALVVHTAMGSRFTSRPPHWSSPRRTPNITLLLLRITVVAVTPPPLASLPPDHNDLQLQPRFSACTSPESAVCDPSWAPSFALDVHHIVRQRPDVRPQVAVGGLSKPRAA